MARYGPILQTIASSPQDMTYISTVTSSSNGTAATSPPKLVTPTELSSASPPKFSTTVALMTGMDSSLMDRGEESDSGCSTTDEELCDITNKMNSVGARGDHSDSLSVAASAVTTCSHKMSASSASSGCACLCDDDSNHNIMFVMEPTQDSEIDLDEIENN